MTSRGSKVSKRVQAGQSPLGKKPLGRPPLASKNLPNWPSVVKNPVGRPPLSKARRVRPPLFVKTLYNVDTRQGLASPSKNLERASFDEMSGKSSVENRCSNTNSNNATHLNASSNSTPDSRPSLFDSLLESKRVLVASVTVNPNRPASIPTLFKQKKAKSNAATVDGGESSSRQRALPLKMKPRRRSAIAGENFVASCLLFSKNSRKSAPNDKKRPVGRPRKTPLLKEKKAVIKVPPAKSIKNSASVEGFEAQDDNDTGKIKSPNEGDGQVAFARPWITGLSQNRPDLADLSASSPFRMSNSSSAAFKIMFRNPSAHAQKKKSALFSKLSRSSMTTYRDMNQFGDDLDEDNDASSSSSSESELSCSSSTESSCDSSSGEDMTSLNPIGLFTDKKWRDSEQNGNTKVKSEKLSSARKANCKKKNEINEEKLSMSKTNESDQFGIHNPETAEPAKRKRGRPRKHPLKRQIDNAFINQEVSFITKPDITDLTTSEEISRNGNDLSEPSSPIGDHRFAASTPTPAEEHDLNSSCSSSSDQSDDEQEESFSNKLKNLEDCDDAVTSPPALTTHCDESSNRASPSDKDPSVDVPSELDESSVLPCAREQSSDAENAFLSKRDPTLLAWQSTSSSMQSWSCAHADAECDLSSTLDAGTAALDESFSNIFPSVDSVSMSSQSALGSGESSKPVFPVPESSKPSEELTQVSFSLFSDINSLSFTFIVRCYLLYSRIAWLLYHVQTKFTCF